MRFSSVTDQFFGFYLQFLMKFLSNPQIRPNIYHHLKNMQIRLRLTSISPRRTKYDLLFKSPTVALLCTPTVYNNKLQKTRHTTT